MADPNDPIIPADGARRGITCEFCECSLSASGEVLKKGTRAKALNALDDDNEKLRAKLATAETQIAALKTDLDAARTPAPAATRRGLLDPDE